MIRAPGSGRRGRAALRERVTLYARLPVAGLVKTRLIPALGPDGAAALHGDLLALMLDVLRRWCTEPERDVEFRFTGGDAAAALACLPGPLRGHPRVRCVEQGEGDLGDRMARGFDDARADGVDLAVAIGADCATLTELVLERAFRRLDRSDVVIVPAADGGYCLLGVRAPGPSRSAALLRGIDWGTDRVCAQTRTRATSAGWRIALLETRWDVDRPEDVERCRPLLEPGVPRPAASVIIAARNERAWVAEAVASARREPDCEVIVVDGASEDDTARCAAAAGARVLSVAGRAVGRGAQMAAGAALARAPLLVFVHADTRLPPAWLRAARDVLSTPGARPTVAGAFRFRLDDPSRWARVLERLTALRLTLGGTPGGDQGLFIAREDYERLGGFASVPILEDLLFARRVRGAGRLRIAGPAAVTSARAWRSGGWVRMSLANRLVVLGAWLGVDGGRLSAFRAGRIHHGMIRKDMLRQGMLRLGTVDHGDPAGGAPASVDRSARGPEDGQ